MIYDFHMSATMPKIRNLFVYYVKNNSNTQKNNKNKRTKQLELLVFLIS